jgi:hypothetical protein
MTIPNAEKLYIIQVFVILLLFETIYVQAGKKKTEQTRELRKIMAQQVLGHYYMSHYL